MSNKLAFFPMYASVFLNDRNVRRMDCAARGLYITLLCECWINGGLPDDPADVATIIGRPEDEVKHSWESVSSVLIKRDDGLLYSSRLEEERERALGICEKRSASATEMHRRRKAKADEEYYASNANAEQMHENGSKSSANAEQMHENGSKSNANAHANAEQMQSKSSDNTIQDNTIHSSVSSLRSETGNGASLPLPPGEGVKKKRRKDWVPTTPPDTLPKSIPEEPEALREYARWFMAEYGNIRDAERQTTGATPWVRALDALRVKGATTVEAARLFVRARNLKAKAPLFGEECKSVPPMFQRPTGANSRPQGVDSNRPSSEYIEPERRDRPSLRAFRDSLPPEERERIDAEARANMERVRKMNGLPPTEAAEG